MIDLKYALRQLRKTPGFTTTALASLSIGVSACVIVFSVVNAVLLSPLQFPESDRVLVIEESLPPVIPEFSVAPGNYLEWTKRARAFEALAATLDAHYSLTRANMNPVRVGALRATASALSTYRVNPMIGRNFSAGEEVAGRDNVTILSHRLWTTVFGAQREVVGQNIQLNGRPFTVIGVMPAKSPLSNDVELLTPLAFNNDDRVNFGEHSLYVFGRLNPGISVDRARAEMLALSAELAREHPGEEGWRAIVTPMLDSDVGDVRPLLWSGLGAVGLLMLIACANLANLMLARGTARAQEMAVRAALGAAGWRILRPLLLENVILAVVGGLVGVLMAHEGLTVLKAIAPDSLPRAAEIGIDVRVLVFTLVITAATVMISGFPPAWQATRRNINTVARAGEDSGRRGVHSLRGLLAGAEFAIALVLLVGAGLLMRSLVHLRQVNPGFKPENTLAVGLSLPPETYASPGQQIVFLENVLRGLASLPGVQAVGASQAVPFTGHAEARHFSLPGRKAANADNEPICSHFTVSQDYFAAMGIPLLRGRAFDSRDVSSGGRVAIVSESLAHRFFPDGNPIGQRINVTNGPETWREIVGVVGDVKPKRLDVEATLQTYEPFAQQPGPEITVVLRTKAIQGLGDAIRSAISAADGTLAVAEIRPLTDYIADSLRQERFATVLFAAFAAVALLLSMIGIYGVMAYWVSQRKKEIAIRVAVGARMGDVLGLVLLQGARIVALGLLVGGVASLVLMRFIESMLFQVKAHDPLTIVGVFTLLAGVGGLACLIPAWQAANVEPSDLLRPQ